MGRAQLSGVGSVPGPRFDIRGPPAGPESTRRADPIATPSPRAHSRSLGLTISPDATALQIANAIIADQGARSVVSVRAATAAPSSSPARLGFFTGSFDPPTKAHLSILRELIDNHGFDKVVVVVNQRNAKTFKASAKERVDMVLAGLGPSHAKRAIVLAEPTDGKNELLHALRKDSKLPVHRVIGQDSWEVVPDEIQAREDIKWVVIPRADQATEALPTQDNVIVLA